MQNQRLNRLMAKLRSALSQANDPAYVLETLHVIATMNPESPRYISKLSSTCSVCGYEITIDISRDIMPLELAKVIRDIRATCPSCLDDGLPMLEDEVEERDHEN